METARKIKDFADDIGRPMNEVSVNWLRQKDEVTSIIGGASSVGQLEKNIHALTWELDEEMLSKLNEIIAPLEFV